MVLSNQDNILWWPLPAGLTGIIQGTHKRALLTTTPEVTCKRFLSLRLIHWDTPDLLGRKTSLSALKVCLHDTRGPQGLNKEHFAADMTSKVASAVLRRRDHGSLLERLVINVKASNSTLLTGSAVAAVPACILTHV